MKKGFTLVELIGVIVILALVALIAIPSVSNIVGTNKRELCATQMENILLAAQSWASNNKDILPSNDGDTKTIILNDLIEGGFIEEPTNALTEEPFDKNIKIIITRVGQKYEYEFENNYKISEICKTTSKTEKNVNHSIKINLETATATTNNMVIPFSITGSPYKIVCRYTNKKGNYTSNGNVSGNKCILSNLKANTKYYYEVCAVDKDDNDIICSEKSENTKKIEPISTVVSNIPINIIDGYVRSQNVKVTYNPSNISNPSYYIKSTKSGKSNITLNYVCGNGNLPGDCTSITGTTNLNLGYWYKVNNTNITISYTQNNLNSNKLYALIYDGVNYSDMASVTLAKVDTTKPNITLKQPEVTATSISINYDISDSSGIGNYTCEYSDTIKYSSSGSNTTSYIQYKKTTNYNSKNCTITGLSASKKYYYRICATDKVGNPTNGITNNCKEGTATTAEVITAPTLSSSSSGYASITANYTAGSATSGIKSTNCYLTNSSGTVSANGTLSGNSCIFNVTATKANTTYYFKKCITSNNGNTACSTVSSKANIGYCTSGYYTSTTSTSCLIYGTCSNYCNGSTVYATKRTTTKNTSKYNNLDCGTTTSDQANGCSKSCGTANALHYSSAEQLAKFYCTATNKSTGKAVESGPFYKWRVTCTTNSTNNGSVCSSTNYVRIKTTSGNPEQTCTQNYPTAYAFCKEKYPSKTYSNVGVGGGLIESF